MTYNIHKCVGGMDRRYDPMRVVSVIAYYDPDIVLLQEAAGRATEHARQNQTDVLGDLLGYRHRVYFPQVTRRGGQYGNAILSRSPIAETSHIDLTMPLKKRRGAIHSRIRLRLTTGGARTLHVYNLHLGLSGLERRAQLRRFLKSHPFALLHVRTPIIVGGDFNDVWGTLGKKILNPAGFRGMLRNLRTFPAFAPLRALDALYVRGDIQILHAQRADTDASHLASDHLPIVADVSLI